MTKLLDFMFKLLYFTLIICQQKVRHLLNTEGETKKREQVPYRLLPTAPLEI